MRTSLVRALISLIYLSAFLGMVPPAAAQEPKDPMSAEVGELVKVKVYFARNGKLALVHRVIPMPEGKRIARATMQLLVDGPTTQERAYGITSAIPFLVNVEDVTLDAESGVATSTLTRHFTLITNGTSAELRFAQVVYTLTQFESIRSVRVEADRETNGPGDEDPDVVSGLGVVYERGDLEGNLNGVFFDSVGIGDKIGSPLRLTGYANVFEGQFHVFLFDMLGNELSSTPIGAAWGGNYGTFDGELWFDASLAKTDLVMLTVFAVSGYAGDRNMPELVNLPLWLAD